MIALVAFAAPVALASEPGAEPPVDAASRNARGRKLSVSGVFLGYAGTGLVVSAAFVGSGRDPNRGLTDAQLWGAFGVGSGLSMVGAGLQLWGSATQGPALRALGGPRRRALRIAGAGLSALTLGVGGAAIARIANPEWRPGAGNLTFAAAGLSLLGSTAHGLLLIDGDEVARRRGPTVAIRVGPGHATVLGVF